MQAEHEDMLGGSQCSREAWNAALKENVAATVESLERGPGIIQEPSKIPISPLLALPVEATFREMTDFIVALRREGCTKVQMFGLEVVFPPKAVALPLQQMAAQSLLQNAQVSQRLQDLGAIGFTPPPPPPGVTPYADAMAEMHPPTPREQRQKSEAEKQAEYERVLFYSADAQGAE